MKGSKTKKTASVPAKGKRSYSTRGDSSLAKFYSSNGQIFGTLTLDTRHHQSDSTYPVAIRVACEGKAIYLFVGKRCTSNEWSELCESEKQARNKKFAERKGLKARMDKVAEMVDELVAKECFTLQRLKNLYEGKENLTNGNTIYTIWEQYIKEKIENDKAGSARCSRDIYKRFCRDMGMNVGSGAEVRGWTLRRANQISSSCGT
jgi:hypothetical protein